MAGELVPSRGPRQPRHHHVSTIPTTPLPVSPSYGALARGLASSAVLVGLQWLVAAHRLAPQESVNYLTASSEVVGGAPPVTDQALLTALGCMLAIGSADGLVSAWRAALGWLAHGQKLRVLKRKRNWHIAQRQACQAERDGYVRARAVHRTAFDQAETQEISARTLFCSP